MPPERKIILFTPLRDEAGAIDALFAAVEAQTQPVDTWVIVENGSSDGSIEKLAARAGTSSVRNVVVLNIGSPTDPYALGTKVSQVIAHGIAVARAFPDFDAYTHLGVLDADCFPEPDYYRRLTAFLDADPAVGITSGIIRMADGTLDEASTDWVRGGCRLWRMACFREAGFIVGPSWDALNSAKAAVRGWSSVVCREARVTSREVGARSSQAYYGMATYYRGLAPSYVLMRGAYLALRSPRKAWQYLHGYFSCLARGAPRVDDPEILAYFRRQSVLQAVRNALWRKAS